MFAKTFEVKYHFHFTEAEIDDIAAGLKVSIFLSVPSLAT